MRLPEIIQPIIGGNFNGAEYISRTVLELPVGWIKMARGQNTDAVITVELRGDSASLDQMFNLSAANATKFAKGVSDAFNVSSKPAIDSIRAISKEKDLLIAQY